jgi:hypothetical protein
MLKFALFSAVAFSAVFVTACSSEPTRSFVRHGEKLANRANAINRIAIVSDVTLMRNVLAGDNYWSVKDSLAAEGLMLKAAKSYLSAKGYQVVQTSSPLAGGFRSRKALMKFAEEAGGQVQETHAPLFVDRALASADPASETARQDSLMETLAAVVKSVGDDRQGSGVPPCCETGHSRKVVNGIAHGAGADAVLFLIGNGVIVPGEQSALQGVGLAVLTTVLTLGMFTYTQWSVSALDTYAVLVDGASGEVLWSNALKLKGGGLTSESYYQDQWAKAVLFHLNGKDQANTGTG